MHAISQPNNIETVKLLLKYGANPEWKDVNGKTIVDAANIKDNKEVIDLITQEIKVPKERATSKRSRSYRSIEGSWLNIGRCVSYCHKRL